MMIVKITQMKFTEGLFLILHNVKCATKLDDLIMLERCRAVVTHTRCPTTSKFDAW